MDQSCQKEMYNIAQNKRLLLGAMFYVIISR